MRDHYIHCPKPITTQEGPDMKASTIASILAAAAITLAAGGAAAEGDAALGEKVFKKCKACHSLEAGKKKIGPSLNGVFGRTSGTVEGFKYSKAMVEAAIVWDETTVDAYLADPKGYIPKNKMAFPGVKKEADRANVIAYLMEATK